MTATVAHLCRGNPCDVCGRSFTAASADYLFESPRVLSFFPATKRPRSYTLRHFDRPWTANAQRRMHHHEQARLVAEWRWAFGLLAREAKVPHLDQIAVTVHSELKGRRQRDLGAEAPAAKAAIDGLVDAKVVRDDTTAHVVRLTYLPAVLGAERDALVLVIEEVTG